MMTRAWGRVRVCSMPLGGRGFLGGVSCFMLAAWMHDLSPFLVRFSDSIGVRWYGLSYAIGFLIAWLILRFAARRNMTPIPEYRLADMLLILVFSVIVGGRVGYAVVYDPALITEFSSSPPFWGMFAITKGGMAYHGAVVGVMIGGWIVSRGFKERGKRMYATPWRHVMDLCAFACTIGLGLGRVANFINGELLGKIVAAPGEPAPWWSVKFPQELLDGHAPELTPEQQVKLDELIKSVGPIATRDERVDSIARMIEAVQHSGTQTATRLAKDLPALLSARHPSQLYQAFFEGVVLTVIVWFVWRKARKPGVVGAWFLIGYGVLRVVAEFFRLPDAQFGNSGRIGAMGIELSRGQWLSVAMVVAGLVALVVVSRRDELRFAGWMKRAQQ